MASKYFGTKGSQVREYQRMLNRFGAKLDVDGIWGKKTEAAYNRYLDQFERYFNRDPRDATPGVPEQPAYEVWDFTPRDEETLRAQAERRYGDLYEEEIADARKRAEQSAADKQGDIDALAGELEGQLAALASQYESARQNLYNQALSRGMGRSSYVTDNLANNLSSEVNASRSLEKQSDDTRARLLKEIEGIGNDLGDTTNRYKAQRERKILGAIEDYRDEDRETAIEARKYNNDLALREREYREMVRQFKEEMRYKRSKR